MTTLGTHDPAAMAFVYAVLRRNEGEPVSAGERAIFDKLFLPQATDGPAILDRKAASRQRAVWGLEAAMPSAEIIRQQFMFWDLTDKRTAQEVAA